MAKDNTIDVAFASQSDENMQIELSKLNATATVPDFVASNNIKYVAYGSTKSGYRSGDYPERLLGLYNTSTYHSAFINRKSLLTVGGGASVLDATKTVLTNAFLTNINFGSNSKQSILNYRIFGGYAHLVTLSRDFSTITRVEPVAWEDIRSTKYDKYAEHAGWYVSDDWSKSRPSFEHYDNFDEDLLKGYAASYETALNSQNSETLTELSNLPHAYINVYYDVAPGRRYYPLPSYHASINSIDASSQIDVYAKNSLRNGFAADTIIVLKGDKTKRERDIEARKVQLAYTGAVNQGTAVVIHAKTEDEVPTINRIAPPNSDGRLQQIIDETITRILAAHEINSPALIGIPTPGNLGGGSELETAYEIFVNTTIKPAQITLAATYNQYLTYNGLSEIEFNRFELINTQADDQSTTN